MRISDWSSDVCSSDLSSTIAIDTPSAPTFLRSASTLSPMSAGGSAHAGIATDSISDRASRCFMAGRSEEHTSELQSLMRISYAVFCLKTKKNHTQKLKPQTNHDIK